jgi:hypothetical protein
MNVTSTAGSMLMNGLVCPGTLNSAISNGGSILPSGIISLHGGANSDN